MAGGGVGIAVVGAGKIGRHRARLAAQHAGVEFLAITDVDRDANAALIVPDGPPPWSN